MTQERPEVRAGVGGPVVHTSGGPEVPEPEPVAPRPWSWLVWLLLAGSALSLAGLAWQAYRGFVPDFPEEFGEQPEVPLLTRVANTVSYLGLDGQVLVPAAALSGAVWLLLPRRDRSPARLAGALALTLAAAMAVLFALQLWVVLDVPSEATTSDGGTFYFSGPERVRVATTAVASALIGAWALVLWQLLRHAGPPAPGPGDDASHALGEPAAEPEQEPAPASSAAPTVHAERLPVDERSDFRVRFDVDPHEAFRRASGNGRAGDDGRSNGNGRRDEGGHPDGDGRHSSHVRPGAEGGALRDDVATDDPAAAFRPPPR